MRNFLLKVIFILFFGVTASSFAQTNNDDLQIGLNFINQKDFASAVFPLQKVLHDDPNNQVARKGLAIALIGIEKFSAASREIAVILAKEPKNPQLLELAAQCFFRQTRFIEAEKVLRRRLVLPDAKAEIYAQLGDAVEAQKRTDEAIEYYKKSVEMSPNSITFRYALGALYWKKIRYDEAEAEFLEILRQQPSEPRASFNLGDIYLTRGDAQKALPFLQIAAKAFPKEYDTRFALGRALLAANNPNQAIEELTFAIKINDTIAEGFFYLGKALQRVGRKEEAQEAFRKTQELQNSKRQSEAIPKN